MIRLLLLSAGFATMILAQPGDADANGIRWVWSGGKWVASAIAGGVLYDGVKSGAEAAEPEEWRPPPSARSDPYGSAWAPRATGVCVMPDGTNCPLAYTLPGAPCSCY